MGSETRRRTRLVPVRMSDEEHAAILDAANASSLAPSTYMRELALAHRPRTTIDQQAIHRLALLHGDLGRIGGLFRMWLANDERVDFARALDIPGAADELRELMATIAATVREL